MLQVKGQKKTQKEKPKVDKQEVEIRQRMTVVALAQAMNKDFGKKLDETLRLSKIRFYCVFILRPSHSAEGFFVSVFQITLWKLC